jgi:hypothetical protein
VETAFKKWILEGQQLSEIKVDLHASFAASFLTNYLHGLRIISKTAPEPEKTHRPLSILDGPN